MNFGGLQKLTLLDFPGHTACTLFTMSCNFRCPFCHNAPLVTGGNNLSIPEEEILEFLSTRKGKLDGVCITGGEPLMHKNLGRFIAKVKAMGFKVKLDTNGSFYGQLKELLSGGLIDYVAMDIKNSFENYNRSTGVECDIRSIKNSIALLMEGKVYYEFRTTVVRELNSFEDIKKIAQYISGAEGYYLQKFKDSGNLIGSGLTAYTDSEMKQLCELARQSGVDACFLRGIE